MFILRNQNGMETLNIIDLNSSQVNDFLALTVYYYSKRANEMKIFKGRSNERATMINMDVSAAIINIWSLLINMIPVITWRISSSRY